MNHRVSQKLKSNFLRLRLVYPSKETIHMPAPHRIRRGQSKISNCFLDAVANWIADRRLEPDLNAPARRAVCPTIGNERKFLRDRIGEESLCRGVYVGHRQRSCDLIERADLDFG